jgi:hypothetical protein
MTCWVPSRSDEDDVAFLEVEHETKKAAITARDIDLTNIFISK